MLTGRPTPAQVEDSRVDIRRQLRHRTRHHLATFTSLLKASNSPAAPHLPRQKNLTRSIHAPAAPSHRSRPHPQAFPAKSRATSAHSRRSRIRTARRLSPPRDSSSQSQRHRNYFAQSHLPTFRENGSRDHIRRNRRNRNLDQRQRGRWSDSWTAMRRK